MSRWFLPETPDVLGLLGQQIEVTIAGMDAFARLAAGEAAAQAEVRTYEHRADERKPELHRTLRTAFITPLEPEDLFALSRGIDRILNEAKDAVRESEVMDCPPDEPFARWPFSWRPRCESSTQPWRRSHPASPARPPARTARSRPHDGSNAFTVRRWASFCPSRTSAR